MRLKPLIRAIAAAVIAAAASGCTDNAHLQQALANANITLAGRDNGMGGHCDGLTLSGDTVILTYNYWPEIAGEELLSDPEVTELNRPGSLRGMQALLREYGKVADAMVKNHAGFVYRRQFADGHTDVYFAPREVKEAIKSQDATK